jgi:hypothetical protein
MDSDASATSSLAPSTSDATRPYTDPLPSPTDQPARGMSFQESIQMNIESQQRELQAQIQLQEQQKLISQRRKEQIKALSVLQQDKVHAVFKLSALVAHCAAPTLLFAPSKTRFLTFFSERRCYACFRIELRYEFKPNWRIQKVYKQITYVQ